MSQSPLNFVASHKKRFIRGCLIILGMGLIITGVVTPQTKQNKTLWIIDNSLSMMVEDIENGSGVIDSRLDLGKKIINSTSRLIEGEQAIMSVAYGAKLELPMTDDLSVLSDVTNGINPIIRGGGTTISTPLEMIRLIYGDLPDLRIFWLTDGEFSDSGSTFSGKLNTKNITFIGLGSKSGGPIPLGYNADGKQKYKEVDGTKIISIRDDASLKKISKTLGTDVIFLDSTKNIPLDLLAQKRTSSDEVIPWYIFLGGLVVLMGLMMPRYNYFFK